MSTHNISFCGEIRKILYVYPLLSGAILIPSFSNILFVSRTLFDFGVSFQFVNP